MMSAAPFPLSLPLSIIVPSIIISFTAMLMLPAMVTNAISLSASTVVPFTSSIITASIFGV